MRYAQMKIMIVDDNPDIRRTLIEILTAESTTFFEATDGIDAVWSYLAERPDILLMDIWMPGMNGIEAARRIRELDPSASIVMLAERDEPALRDRARQAGALGLILKDNLTVLPHFLRMQNINPN